MEKCTFHGLASTEIGAWGVVVLAVAAGAFLTVLFLKGTRTKAAVENKNKNRNKSKKEKTKKVSAVGDAAVLEAGDDGGLDAIIVGAGVAGAALAHTLGKVRFLCLGSRSLHAWERDLFGS